MLVRASRHAVSFRIAVVALLLANAAMDWLVITRSATADHAFDGGDCWVSGTPLQCAAGYATGYYYYYRVNANWSSGSDIRPNAEPGMEDAKTAWGAAPGPQYFVSSTHTSTPFMKVNVLEFPEYVANDPVYDCGMFNPSQCGGPAYAVVRNWKYYDTWVPCYTNACRVTEADVYLSAPWAATCSGGRTRAVWKYVLAHEFGHVQGLNDHDSGSILMNNSWPTSCAPSTTAQSPTSTDLGTAIPPGATSCTNPKGIRCIFKWPN